MRGVCMVWVWVLCKCDDVSARALVASVVVPPYHGGAVLRVRLYGIRAALARRTRACSWIAAAPVGT